MGRTKATKREPVEISWTNGARINHPAEPVHAHVERIRGLYGDCPPEMLLDAARPANSSIHGLFEWNNQVAAEKHRLSQAQHAIACLRVKYDDDEEPKPAFYSVRLVNDDEEISHTYVDRDTALNDPAVRLQGIDAVLTTVRGVHRRYGHLTELDPLWQAARKMEKKFLDDDD